MTCKMSVGQLDYSGKYPMAHAMCFHRSLKEADEGEERGLLHV